MTLINPILSEWKWVGREIDRLPTPSLRLPLPLIDVSSHLWHRCKISNEVMRNKVKDCRKIFPFWNITILKCYWTISIRVSATLKYFLRRCRNFKFQRCGRWAVLETLDWFIYFLIYNKWKLILNCF